MIGISEMRYGVLLRGLKMAYLVIGVAASDVVTDARRDKRRPTALAYGIGPKRAMTLLASNRQERAGGKAALACYFALPFDVATRRYNVRV
jgi:hypothetical protein